MKNHIRNRPCSRGILLSVWGCGWHGAPGGILPPGLPSQILCGLLCEQQARRTGRDGAGRLCPRKWRCWGWQLGCSRAAVGCPEPPSSPGAGATGSLCMQVPPGAGTPWGRYPLGFVPTGVPAAPPGTAPCPHLDTSRMPSLLTRFPIWHLGRHGSPKLPFSDQLGSRLVNTR